MTQLWTNMGHQAYPPTHFRCCTIADTSMQTNPMLGLESQLSHRRLSVLLFSYQIQSELKTWKKDNDDKWPLNPTRSRFIQRKITHLTEFFILNDFEKMKNSIFFDSVIILLTSNMLLAPTGALYIMIC